MQDIDLSSPFGARVLQSAGVRFIHAHPRLPENQDLYFIKYGVHGCAMPAWGNIMADSEIWQVVTFLNHLDNLSPSVQQELH